MVFNKKMDTFTIQLTTMVTVLLIFVILMAWSYVALKQITQFRYMVNTQSQI
jgi:hypothetical protein